MSKRFVSIVMVLMSVLLLASCGAAPVSQTTPPEQTAAPTESTVSEETTTPTETEAPAAAPSVTEAPTEPAPTVTGGLPYLQQIKRADQSIFSGPGYDYAFVGTVRQVGTYTIVEESVDFEGNLWGKLKSGMGWVNLTEIQSWDSQSALISANYADENLLLHGAYHHYASGHEYSTPIAFRAYGILRDVTLFYVEYDADGAFPGSDFFTLPEMTQEMPLVAELAFPGDMTTYGIRFMDEAGVAHVYHIYVSGRNGALVLVEKF